MNRIQNSLWMGAVISGLLTYTAICHINFLCSWVCYVPLFMAIHDKPAKRVAKSGLIFGFTFSCLAFFWMVPGAERFTGYNMLYGVGVFFIAAAFYSFFCAVLLYCFIRLKKKDGRTTLIIINSISAAALFCLAEAFLMVLSTGFPWFDVHSGNGLAENIYAIQPASLFSIHILTFIMVCVNYMIAIIFVKRLWIKLYIPVSIFVAYLLIGFLLLQRFNNNLPVSKTFSVAILSENISPDIKWDDNTGNMLVKKLLDLNRVAVASKPSMSLWSESAIPWTYRPDDDLVKEVLNITRPSLVTHIMGINTAYQENEVFNSAYCILPNGDVAGRYDKQFLLALIEKPLNGVLMPFFSSKGFVARSNKEHAAPLNTPFGKAGILICNEAAVPDAAANMVRRGANFLFNISNDGWFNDTYIVRLHFYYARLRAVESRKDLAINSNNGYSGLIRASGEIIEQEISEDPYVKMISMQPNEVKSLASALPYLFVIFCGVYLLMIIASNLLGLRDR